MNSNKQKDWAGFSALIIFLVFTARTETQAPCEYDVTIIQAPTDCGQFGTVNTFGLGINENGAVVGYYQCPLWQHSEAFVWTAEDGFVTLDRPEGVYSAGAVDINDNGVICGTAWMSGVGQRGFVYDNGEWTILETVVPDGGWSSASAINNAGVVVGQRSITENLNPQNAYFWSAEKGFTDLGVMNGPNSAATDINENSDVCGWTGNGGSISEAFLWQGEKLILLGTITDGFTSKALALNNDRSIVGSGRLDKDGKPVGVTRAFLWENGIYSMLGTLPQHSRSSAGDISDDRLIVGKSSNVDGNPNIAHGFIWENGILHNLNNLVMVKLNVLLESAGTIANTGQIIANCDDGKGEIVAFLLTP